MDVIEHLPNPVPILRELTRILAPGGQLLVITPEWRYGTSSDPTYHLTEYTCNELNQLSRCVEAGWRV
jgi:2-polyprenyl-3-methyl-5-hydroxy-6-metoxy-1,4-benzoquinol methylase